MAELSTSASGKRGPDSPLADPRLPWLVFPLLMAGFWVTESWLHTTFFDDRTFLQDLRPDGHELWMRILVGGCLLVVTVMWSLAVRQRNSYIRELSEYQTRLREMSSRLAYGDSEERRELSDRLHEDIAQSLSAAQMFLSGVEASTAVGAEGLASAASIVADDIAHIREIADELSPPSLDDYGLWTPLEQLCAKAMRRTGNSVECDLDCEAPLAREVLLASFRAISEVIEVAAGDVATGAVHVSAECRDRDIAVTVAWVGSDAHGFFGPTQLVTGVGGRFSARSDSDGTCVVVTIPTVE